MKKYDRHRQTILDSSNGYKILLTTLCWGVQIPAVVLIFYGHPMNLVNLALFIFWSWALYPTFKSWFKAGSDKPKPEKIVDPLNDSHTAFEDSVRIAIRYDNDDDNFLFFTGHHYRWTVTDGKKIVRHGYASDRNDKNAALIRAREEADAALHEYRASLDVPDSVDYTA